MIEFRHGADPKNFIDTNAEYYYTDLGMLELVLSKMHIDTVNYVEDTLFDHPFTWD